jgi:hypothetical protein
VALPPVSTTLAKLLAKFAADVVDTGGKFAPGVVDTGGAIGLTEIFRTKKSDVHSFFLCIFSLIFAVLTSFSQISAKTHELLVSALFLEMYFDKCYFSQLLTAENQKIRFISCAFKFQP